MGHYWAGVVMDRAHIMHDTGPRFLASYNIYLKLQEILIIFYVSQIFSLFTIEINGVCPHLTSVY